MTGNSRQPLGVQSTFGNRQTFQKEPASSTMLRNSEVFRSSRAKEQSSYVGEFHGGLREGEGPRAQLTQLGAQDSGNARTKVAGRSSRESLA